MIILEDDRIKTNYSKNKSYAELSKLSLQCGVDKHVVMDIEKHVREKHVVMDRGMGNEGMHDVTDGEMQSVTDRGMSQASSPRVGISCKSRGESRTSQSGVGICCTNKYSINDGEMSQTN